MQAKGGKPGFEWERLQIENPGLRLTSLFHQGFITMAQFRGIIAEVDFSSFVLILIILSTKPMLSLILSPIPATVWTFKVDPNLSEEDLDGIIAEIDEDGSGTMDFDEFCEMMMTKPEE